MEKNRTWNEKIRNDDRTEADDIHAKRNMACCPGGMKRLKGEKFREKRRR